VVPKELQGSLVVHVIIKEWVANLHKLCSPESVSHVGIQLACSKFATYEDPLEVHA
jgi:hypothetical protein